MKIFIKNYLENPKFRFKPFLDDFRQLILFWYYDIDFNFDLIIKDRRYLYGHPPHPHLSPPSPTRPVVK